MDNNTKALKSGFWYIISNLVVRGTALITTPIFSRLMTHEQYGDYSNFHSWMNIAVILVTMRMEASLISAKFDFRDNLNKYNRTMICLTAVMVAVWAAVTNLFSETFCNILGFGRLYTNLLLAYCLSHAIINIFQINERYMYRYKRSVFISMTAAISTTLVSVLLVVFMQDKLTGRVVGGILPSVVLSLLLILYFIKDGVDIDFSAIPYALKICTPYVPHLLSLQVLNSVDRIMIKRICGSADNALYTIAYICGHMVTLLMTSMNSAFSPWLGDKLNEKDYESIKKVSRYYILAFSALALVMMLLAPEILLIMGGRSYLEAKYVMPPVAMGCVCQFLYTLYVNVEQFKKKTVGMAFASIGAAFLNYSLNAYFIPRYGYIAAAYTTLVGYLFLLAVHMILVKRMGMANIYDTRFVIFLVAVMGGLTLGVNYLYGNQIARYATVAVAGTILAYEFYKHKELLLRVIKRDKEESDR